MRTLSVSPMDAAAPDGIQDLDNRIVDGLRSLEQRIAQRLRFPIGTWELDIRRGTESVIGHEFTPELAAGVISAAIRDEGGAEVTDVVDVTATIDSVTRQFRYSATVRTIYGVMQLTGTAV